MSDSNGALIALVVVCLIAILAVGGFLIVSQTSDSYMENDDNSKNMYNQDLVLVNKKLSDLQAENTRLENELKANEANNPYIDDEYYGNDYRCRDLDDEEEEIEDDIDDVEEEIDDLEDEIAELELVIAQKKANNQTTTTEEAELDDLEDDLEEEEDDLDDLEDDLDEIDDLQEDYKCYENYLYDYYKY
jgi:chromosome segregation ATPase